MTEASLMAHDVFVSHSSKDKPTADAVCAVLEAKGIRCWVAPRDVFPGSDWGASIIDAIKNARVMVLVFSGHANDSPHISREVERAASRRIPIIPIRIEHVSPTNTLEYFLSTPHWLDAFTPPMEQHLEHLAKVIAQILARPLTDRVTGLSAARSSSTSDSNEPPREELKTGTVSQPRAESNDPEHGERQRAADRASREANEADTRLRQLAAENLRVAEERRRAAEGLAAKAEPLDPSGPPGKAPIGQETAQSPAQMPTSALEEKGVGKQKHRTELWLAAATAVLMLAALGYNFGVYQPGQRQERAAEQARISEANRLADEKRAADEKIAADEKSAADEKARQAIVPGGLNIDSDPTGAAVYQGDKPLGATPYVINQIKPGHYNITLKLEGYKGVDLSLDVIAKQITSQTVTLEKVHAESLETTPEPKEASPTTARSDKAVATVAAADSNNQLTADEKQRIASKRAEISAQRDALGLMGVLDQKGNTLIGAPLVIYSSPDLVLSPGYVALKPGILLATIDLAKLFDGDPETREKQEELQADEAKAKDKLGQITKEGQALVEQYKELSDQAHNPTATAEGKAQAQAQAEKKLDEIHQKQAEQKTFIADTKTFLQQRFQTFKVMKVAQLIRRETERLTGVPRGAILVLDTSGPSAIGISPVIYSDPVFGADASSPRPPIRLLVVDVTKLFEAHWKTQEQQAKFNSDEAKAKEELDQITKEGNALVEQYKELDDQAHNPTATAEAKAVAQDQLQKKLDEIHKKQDEQQTFIKNTRDTLTQRFQTFKSLMLEEITKVAADVARAKGCNLLIDKSGPASNMDTFPFLVASDGRLDVTDAVMSGINKDRP